MARPNVPQFGNWKNDDKTPYTMYFEKARQTRGTGKIINPNDPKENPDMFPNLDPAPIVAPHSKPKRQTEESIRRGRQMARDHRLSKEDGTEFRQYTNSPVHNENMERRGTIDPSHQRSRGSSTSRTGRPSIGSEHSLDKSPLHPHYQAKVNNAGTSFETSHSTPGRSKVKQESFGRGAAVPRFGEWDESDPQSADKYTLIFNKVREEKQGNSSGTPSRTSYTTPKHNNEEKKMKCCFL